jgi:ATP-dependent DNA helicase DinG
MTLPQPQDPSWGDPSLPAKITSFRPAQVTAIDEILWHYQFGAKVVALEAPTGAGKTLIGEVVRRKLEGAGLYMCVDRGLQRQFEGDFKYAKVMMGRRNYPTYHFPEEFDAPDRLSCEDCTISDKAKECKYCPAPVKIHCPYRNAKELALRGPLTCVNASYFLTECNGPGAFSGWPLIIADECDQLEDVLMGYAEVKVSHKRMHEWQVEAPESFIQNALGKPPVEDVRDWANRLMHAANIDLSRLDPESGDVRERRQHRVLTNLILRLDKLAEDFATGGWVCNAQSSESAVIFRPVKVDHMAKDLLWKHGKRWLLMSATVLGAKELLADLGVHDYWQGVSMPSSFPVENRPIYYRPAAHVTRENMSQAIPALAKAVTGIMAAHPNERILVHTVSYQLARSLKSLLTDPRCLWLEGSDQRADLIENYRLKPNSVLLAPALERGLDLPDDACRVVVVCKIPYPNLGDPQVRARYDLAGGRDWYIGRALRSLVQATGRGVRHEKDWAATYILDEQFGRIVNRNAYRLPKWWLDAVKW